MVTEASSRSECGTRARILILGMVQRTPVGEGMSSERSDQGRNDGRKGVTSSNLRKAMRVATLFTGVAACTAGVTQVAHAQDVTHTPVKPAPTHAGRTLRPAGVFGSIRYQIMCGSSKATWLHYVTSSTTVQGLNWNPYVCFGYQGIYPSPPGVGILAECGGNNHGWLTVKNTGASTAISYGPGEGYRDMRYDHLEYVEIDSWTGNDKCPLSP